MNRRTFNKYLLAAPIALVALLLRRPTSSVVREKEKPEEFHPNCRTCTHKGTDFYYGLCPQNDIEADKLPQEKNHCYYYQNLDKRLKREAWVRTNHLRPEEVELWAWNKWPLYYNSRLEKKENVVVALRKALKTHTFQKYI